MSTGSRSGIRQHSLRNSSMHTQNRLGAHSTLEGPTAAGRVFGASREFVFYHQRKFQDPAFYPNTVGGNVFTERTQLIIEETLWSLVREDPTKSRRQYQALIMEKLALLNADEDDERQLYVGHSYITSLFEKWRWRYVPLFLPLFPLSSCFSGPPLTSVFFDAAKQLSHPWPQDAREIFSGEHGVL